MYGKLIDNKLEIAPVNKGSVCNYNLNIEEMTKDGYKEVVEAEKPDYPYITTYTETETQIIEAVSPDMETIKQDKIFENDTARDIALNQGVTYQDILFDSDTDQKVNLLATVSMMSNEDTITWFGMDNQPLLCTKLDLINIGGLITQLHTHCWTLNTAYKQAINNASTIEELEGIEIDYES